MRTFGILVGIIVGLLLAGAAAMAVLAWQPAIMAIDRPAPQSFDRSLVKRGRELAAIGNCGDCHTVRGGRVLAGGLPVSTPFGTIYSTNITPDPDTGIGRWPEAAFRRAMRAGVDRDGHHLYPTFPYDHFTHVTDDDDHALYAYLTTREPVRAAAPANRLAFPYDQRFLIAGWKLLFLHREPFRPDDAKSAEWNRGAYLVEGLAHCGACHTPRNRLGAERGGASFSGGDVDNWNAYAINGQSRSPVAWDVEALFAYLRYGWHPDHGTARGPMAQVVSNLSAVPDGDVRAIATYMAGVFGAPAEKRDRQTVLAEVKPKSAALSNSKGAAIYAAACANCHETGRPPPYGGIHLALSTAVTSRDPRNLANIVLAGIRPVEGERSPIMPGFSDSMNDGQLAELLNFIRVQFGRQAPWNDVETAIVQARAAETAYVQTQPAPRNAPTEASQRDKP